MDMLRLAKRTYWTLRLNTGLALSAVGQRFGLDALTYNHVVMDVFAFNAKDASPILTEALIEAFPGTRSVADFGCGPGLYVKALQERGITAIGYERSAYARRYAERTLGVTVRPFDLTQVVTTSPCDVAMSIEVIEHLPPTLGDALIAVMARTAPRIVFSAATPGQGGTGHINEQPPEHWRQRWAAQGFSYLPEASAHARDRLRAATGAPWLAQNVMLFQR